MAKKDKKRHKKLSGNMLIRALDTWQEMVDLEAVQRDMMEADPGHVISASMLVSIAHNGGLVLGAFDGNGLVGGSVSFLGAASDDEDRPAMANLKLFSKLTIVRESHRGKGFGLHLKLAQFEFAKKRGIRLVTWTFDPLDSISAHIGIRKLGVIVSKYHHDLFGQASEDMAGTTDRFHADWWLTSWRVGERLSGKRGALSLAQYVDAGTRILNPTTLNDKALPEPSEDFILPPGALGLIEIPSNFARIGAADSGLGREWRRHMRALFSTVLSSGFVITDFVHELYQGRQRSFYVCSHEGALRTFDQRFNQN